MSYRFPLATATWGQEEQDAIQRVIASGMFTMGVNVQRFEHDFAQYVGSKHCVMVNSGSSAILLMVAALFYTKNSKLKLQRGDEVIVPAVSWSTTYYPLYQYGLKIKFVDIDLHTLNYDLDQLEKAVTGNTRAIMAVNLLGNPNDFARIQKIINGRDIVLMEDNCESMGAQFHGKQAGTFGVMGGYSWPVLEKFSGLKFNQDFFCGYSPERINPGDKEHRLTIIKKVTSGSTPEIADLVDALYNQIITAGTHKACSIKVAEAAKVIENTQRDVNIALINELALIFNKMDIDTEAVLHAAGSKWNFLPFRPGLVGGHCIGVDPYYLTHKAESIGYHPQIILAGRRLNDSMGAYVVTQLVKAMTKRRLRDSGDLAEKMVSLLSLSPEQRSEMGQRGRAKIEVEFDEKIVISKYFSALEEIRVRRQV